MVVNVKPIRANPRQSCRKDFVNNTLIENGSGSRSFPENQNLENEYGFAVQMRKVTTSLQQAFLNRA
jgi:hypothetical protein